MRYDAIGLFWEDRPTETKRGSYLRPMPPIPETGWVTPTELPDLSRAPSFAIDTETKDPNLEAKGPGWARGPDGHIVGISVAVPGSRGWYFPMRHEVEPQFNMDPETVLRWANYHFSGPQPKIGANLLYDVGWLGEEGVTVNGPLFDIQFAEALLNSEAPHVSLEALAQTHLGLGKQSSVLYEWCAEYYGGQANDKQRANIYRSPPRLVGPYAESDATLPMAILQRQWPLLEARGVLDLFNMECGLIPLLIAMRRKGAPVDLEAAEKLYDRFGLEMAEISKKLKHIAGREVNPNATESIKAAFEAVGIDTLGRTAKGAPSYRADILEEIDHPLPNLILEHRKKSKLRSTFINSYILNSHVNGRIHCQFHPLKSDKSGARSGRFSSSDPNLQNIPIRSDEGKLIRELFVATFGHRWRKYDYSQIEYRLLAHHAVGPGSDEIRHRYNSQPDTDYHEFTGELIKLFTGVELDRRPVKNINFGLIYGMGKPSLIRRLGLPVKEGNKLYEDYHRAVPFAKATMDAAAEEAQNFGTVRTFMGRVSDFTLFEPAGYGHEERALPFEMALTKYGRVQRAFTHKALNRKLQGGAADIMKKAMFECYTSGVFDQTGIPLLTVHDELDFEDDCQSDEAFREMAHIMETCVKLRVPIRVDSDIGQRWGDCG